MPNAKSSSPSRYLADLDRRANGFDTIRLIAAIAVLVSHAFPLTAAPEPLMRLSGDQTTMGNLAICVFFLISGYLIPASLDRGSLGRYLERRARRILPGLVVAVLLCAFVLGPILTRLPLQAYFAAPRTWAFLGHAVFFPVEFDLPGVFVSNPERAVNGSLWSLKYEVACYLVLPLAFAFGRWRVSVIAAGWLASFVLSAAIPDTAGSIWGHLRLMGDLFMFFGSGTLMYLCADRIVMRKDWAIVAASVCVAAIFTPVLHAVLATAGAYGLLYFAHHAPARFRRLTARGDLSYGVYLYAFPIQQVLVPVSLAAAAAGVAPAWAANMALALPFTLAAALLSWMVVERPLMASAKTEKVGTPRLA